MLHGKESLREVVPTLYVRDSLFVALDHHFLTLLHQFAVLASRTRAPADAAQRENHFASSLVAYRQTQCANATFNPVIRVKHLRVTCTRELQHEAIHDRSCHEPRECSEYQTNRRHQMRSAREDVACAAEPREKRHHCRGVEPRNMAGRSACSTLNSDAIPAAGMTAVRRQMQTERQVDVKRASKKCQRTESESDQKTEEVNIGPRHRAPRAHASAQTGIRDAKLSG